ncbi:hypothetical protein MSG28_009506 [Choristoneura fumiferana]|uniref:Uncharacterized protein n=1 Tax=Choristoneura fumiferana TaxID=7141 RepID=A0ACC0JBI3_CHOFU|nr:hypothetical protein MSG28_009506 [Choristoneura fumiferana]
MGAKKEVLEVVTGWKAVELVLKCFFIGIWQLIQISVKRLWKGHRRITTNNSQIELTVDSSIGRHCYIKIMRLADSGHHVVTLDLRGTGASEGGSRSDLTPPRAVEELATVMAALGVTDDDPAIVIGFGIGGMLACAAQLVSSARYCGAATLRLVAAPHAADPQLPGILLEFLQPLTTPDAADRQLPEMLLDFLQPKEKLVDEKEVSPKAGLMGRVFGAVRSGRELTARLVLPTQA